MMLPPGWRTDSVPRTMLAWFRAIANERFGPRWRRVVPGRAEVSSVRNAELTCGP